jgi:hypothetical protein
MEVRHRPYETSLDSSPPVTTSCSPYAGWFFTAAFPGSSPASMTCADPLATWLSLVPFPGKDLDTARFPFYCRLLFCLPFWWVCFFSTSGQPDALDIYDMATWLLSLRCAKAESQCNPRIPFQIKRIQIYIHRSGRGYGLAQRIPGGHRHIAKVNRMSISI